MAKIYCAKYETMISGIGENPLPRFRAASHDLSVVTNDDVPVEYTHLLGFDCGKRVLPYTVQDRYSRKLERKSLDAVVLENNYLRATFLPTLGGRMISLFDKTLNRELLYENKTIQFANLAIRNGWFAGGIEWNIGQYGHSCYTSSDVCFTVQEGADGEFLRMLVYERMKKLYFQIDFHLPDDSRMLHAYMRVKNAFDTDTSLYYWTNIAVPERTGTRVFASSNKAFFLNPKAKLGQKEYGYMTLPDIPVFPDIDASYPSSFDKCSLEYFFTCNHDAMPWEAVVNEDGIGLFEASTQPLNYRKMFCWGTGKGGRHWQKFLAPGQNSSYFEVQAGLAPSQLHGLRFGAGEQMDWVQAFGSLSVDPQASELKDYKEAGGIVGEYVEDTVNSAKLQSLLGQYREAADNPGRTLHSLDYWALTEASLNGVEMPGAFDIPPQGNDCWLNYLKTGRLKVNLPYDLPFVTGKCWIAKLRERGNGETAKEKASRLYYLGVALAEEERLSEAEDAFKEAATLFPAPVVYRNLSKLKEKNSDIKAALFYYDKARELGLSIYMEEEYFSLLITAGQYESALDFYNGISSHTDTMLLDRARLALKMHDFTWLKNTFFSLEFANIREGDTVLSDAWIEYHRLQNMEVPPVPENLNFLQMEY